MTGSPLGRIISGMSASWVLIVIGLFAQLLLVPVFLSNWSTELYGTWLAVLALSNLLKFIDIGHQSFIGFDLLRIGSNSRTESAKTFYSALPVTVILGLLQLCFVVIFFIFGNDTITLLSSKPIFIEYSSEFRIALLLNSIVWLLYGGWTSIAGTVLVPLGYFSRIGWWQVSQAFCVALFPGLVVIAGGGFLEAIIAYNAGYLIVGVPAAIDICRVIKKEGVVPVSPSFNLGLKNFNNSLVLSLKTLLDMFRQQHLRIILAPIIGPSALVAFVTMKTGANIMVQGLGTISNPLLPELMRFIKDRKQDNVTFSVASIWLIIIVFLSPLTILSQWIMPSIFPVWTQGKVVYDPVLFALFNLSVLIFAFGQPATAIVRGNNILDKQIYIAIVSTFLLIGLVFMTAPFYGLRGIGFSLVVVELFALASYSKVAYSWIRMNGFIWPTALMKMCAASIVVSFIIILSIALVSHYILEILIFGIILYWILLRKYWQGLPCFGRQKVMSVLVTPFYLLNQRR